MLIIFDLDDTLIDTSGWFVPMKLADGLQVMVANGLKLQDSFEKSLERLEEINRTADDGTDAFKKFLKEIKQPETHLELFKKEYYGPPHVDYYMEPLDGAIETLHKLAENHDLALTTKGQYQQQLTKLHTAGIEKNLFKKILVTPEYNKKECYQQLMQEFNLTNKQLVVVGDKAKTDLLPAIELKIPTVHMLWGRAKHNPSDTANYCISKLSELISIVEELS
tara:strand:+ start:5590 stop:6255 length:666 start_codon:yes stop_codon:yes gene_type:complete